MRRQLEMSQAAGWPTTRVTLLARIRDPSDDLAWREFVDLYSPLIYKYCCARGLQSADARNVSQEVFARVAQAIRGFEYDAQRGQFRAWLGLITHQQMRRYLHGQARAGQGVGAGNSDAFADAQSGEVDGAWIEDFNAHIYACAVERVRAEYDAGAWQAFERVWDRRERPGDVARDLGRDPQWVYHLKYQIVRRLKEEIQRLTDDAPVFHRP